MVAQSLPRPAIITGAANARPSREEAERAVETLIRWAGDDPSREGLLETPQRVAKAFREWFSGYEDDPAEILSRTFEEVAGYDDIVLLKDIPFVSHCEHHMATITGKAVVAYVPDGRVVGISKLARAVDAFARRLQTQETMTAQIADAIDGHLKPKGVAVLIESEHGCMSTRGVEKACVDMVTTRFTGVFRDEPALQDRFLRLAGR